MRRANDAPLFGERASVRVEGRFVDNDRGHRKNVFGLTPAELSMREVLECDICDDVQVCGVGERCSDRYDTTPHGKTLRNAQRAVPTGHP